MNAQSEKDLLIIFPPVTEARLFPYLSLPMLTAYLRKLSFRVEQVDLNLALCHQLLKEDYLREYILENRNSTSIKQKYRNTLAQFLIENLASLKLDVFRSNKIGKHKAKSENVSFLNKCIELFLENSLLKRAFSSFAMMEKILEDKQVSDRAQDELLNLIKNLVEEHQPKVLAISIAFFSQIFPSLIIAKYVKENFTGISIILGGQQVILRHLDFVKINPVLKYIDGLGISSGEETLSAYLHFKNGNLNIVDIPDFISIVNKKIIISPKTSELTLEDFPTPDFSGLKLDNYLIEEIQYPLITCIGCYWGKCIFCSYGNRSHKSKTYQQASPEKIARDCKALVDIYRAHRINFIDENTNLSLVRTAMRLFRKQGGVIEFSTRNRMESILTRKDVCQELKDLGCVLMAAGYDTNSQRLLDLLRKGVKSKDYQKIIDNISDVGIELRLSLLGGIPHETEEEVKDSENFLNHNASKIGIDVMQMLILEPTTYLADSPSSYGIESANFEELSGNELLSYGRGFVGATYKYKDGPGHESRLARFLKTFETVKTKYNEKSPYDRLASKEPEVFIEVGLEITLSPWVRIIDDCMIADLRWQKLYKLPLGIEPYRNKLVIRQVSKTISRAVNLFALSNMIDLGRKESK